MDCFVACFTCSLCKIYDCGNIVILVLFMSIRVRSQIVNYIIHISYVHTPSVSILQSHNKGTLNEPGIRRTQKEEEEEEVDTEKHKTKRKKINWLIYS